MPQEKKDFFISYTSADRQWAEWIAWHLEDAGYSTIIQAWDFRAGGNFILEMHRAAIETGRTIAVLSEKYQQSFYTQPVGRRHWFMIQLARKGLLFRSGLKRSSLKGYLLL